MSSVEFKDGKPLTEDEIHAAAAGELRANYYYQDDTLRENWRKAYHYYKGELPAPDETTESDYVATDISDTIEWILPAILKPLVESPDVVRFDPVSPEDQDQADLESDYVHHTLMKKCNGFEKLYVHIKDALLLKVGVFCTYWDEGVDNRVEEYENLTEVELADLMVPADTSTVRLVSQEMVQVPVTDPMSGAVLQQPDPKWVAQQQQLMAQLPPGQPPPPPQGPPPMVDVTEQRYNVKVRRFTPNGKPVVENCVPEQFQVRFTHSSISLEGARYCRYTVTKTRADLYSEGYDEKKIDEIPAVEGTRSYWDNEVRWAREDVERDQNSLDGERNETGDPSQDPIEVHRVYMTLDTDGDGYEEQLLVVLAGSNGETLLDWYEVPENPFSASTPFIAGHKFHGYSIYDKLKQLTDHKTHLMRMIEDNLELQNNPRKKVIKGAATLSDLLVVQPGGLWRIDQPDAVTEVPTPAFSAPAMQMMQLYDKIRSERTGVDPNAQSISDLMPEESMNSAVERVVSMKEELVGLLIRVFAETGVKDMCLKLRNLLMRYMPREELVQLRNKWTVVNPGNWVERTNTTVVVGLGTGDRIQKTQGLMNVFGIQKELVQTGMLGPLLSAERISHTLSELIRVQRLGDPDDYLLDPSLLDPQNPNRNTKRGQEAMRAQQMKDQMMQQQMQEKQMEQQWNKQIQQMVLQSQQAVEQIRAQAKQYEADSKERTEQKKIMADMQQFMREMRFNWAELATKVEEGQTQRAADVGTTLVTEGLKAQAAKDTAKEQAKAKSNGGGNEA